LYAQEDLASRARTSRSRFLIAHRVFVRHVLVADPWLVASAEMINRRTTALPDLVTALSGADVLASAPC
jgi:hypothetical protein